MEANTTGKVQCNKCKTVYDPVIKVLERVCPECLSMKTVPVEQAQRVSKVKARHLPGLLFCRSRWAYSPWYCFSSTRAEPANWLMRFFTAMRWPLVW